MHRQAGAADLPPESSAEPKAPARGPGSVLRAFTEVREGEAGTALLLMLNLFLLLGAYYLLKTIREPLILTSPGGAEIKSYSAAAIAGLLIILVPLYSALASRVSRVALINGVTAFFIVNLLIFFVFARAGRAVGVPFFIWVGIFNLMIIAQLWAFANDVYTIGQGKRLFAIVGFGASMGAIAGSFVTGKLVERYGPYPFLLGAAAILALSMVITNVVNVRERRAHGGQPLTPGDRAAAQGRPAADTETDEADKHRSGFGLVFSDRYLLLIAGLMVLLNLVNTTGEYILSKTVVQHYIATTGTAATRIDEGKIIGGFYGNYFTWVNIISAIIQAFFVSRIFRLVGVSGAIRALPLVSLVGYASLAVAPVLSFVRGVKIAENSLDYSLQNTARNALYLPTSRAAKYKAKQANDTFFVRLGDVFSAGLVYAGVNWFAFAPRNFAMVNAGLVVVWLVLVFAIGRRFKARAKTA